MSLNLKKSINSISLEATSTVNGVDVLTLSTQVTDSASYSNVQQIVKNQQAYDQNKAAVRKDIQEFSDAIFDAQDELDSSAADNADSAAVSDAPASSASTTTASSTSTAK